MGKKIKQTNLPGLDVDKHEIDELVKKQWRLSSRLGIFVILVVFSIPFLNHFAADFMTTPIWGGFTVTYLAASLLIYPFIWIVAIIYTKKSIELEGGGQ